MNQPHREHFARLMTEHGITDTHGVEVMRLVRRVANAYDVAMEAQTREANLSAPRWRLGQRCSGRTSTTGRWRAQRVAKCQRLARASFSHPVWSRK